MQICAKSFFLLTPGFSPVAEAVIPLCSFFETASGGFKRAHSKRLKPL